MCDWKIGSSPPALTRSVLAAMSGRTKPSSLSSGLVVGVQRDVDGVIFATSSAYAASMSEHSDHVLDRRGGAYSAPPVETGCAVAAGLGKTANGRRDGLAEVMLIAG